MMTKVTMMMIMTTRDDFSDDKNNRGRAHVFRHSHRYHTQWIYWKLIP